MIGAGGARAVILGPILGGVAILVVASAAASQPGLLDAIVRPPAIVGAAVVAACVVGGLGFVRAAVLRLDGAVSAGTTDLRVMLRGIRFVFLAVAAFAAAAGWLLPSPVPLVVALIIAAVDIVETGFLLVVVSDRGR